MFTFLNLTHFKDTLHRFPLAIVSIITLTVLFFVLVHTDAAPREIPLLNRIFTLILTFFLSVGTSLCTEETNTSRIKPVLFQVLPLIVGVLCYLGFMGQADSDIKLSLFLLLLVFALAFLFFAPFLLYKKRNHAEELNIPYSQYFLKVTSVILFGFVLGGLAFGLGALAILAVQILFHIERVSSFQYRAILSLSFFTPLVCLTKLPFHNQLSASHFSLGKFSSFIIKFVLLPAIFIYFLILYAYTVKVLIHFSERPQGEVSWLVVAFSIIGYLTYLLSYFFKELGVVHRFRKVFPFAVIPQLFMLFYAIYLRIAQYDVTVNRYFVVIFGIWLLVVSLYFILSKKKLLLVLPASLAFFAGLISFWPWGVFHLPISRQLDRLEQNLEKAWMLVNGQVHPLTGKIDDHLGKEIYNGIKYLCNFGCEKLAALGDGFVNEERTTAYLVSEYLNVHSKSNWEIDREPEQIMTFYIDLKDKIGLFPLDTTGYDFITRAEISDYKMTLTITDGVLTENFELSEVKQALLSKISQTSSSVMLPKEDLTFTLAGELFDIKLIINSCRLNNPQYEGNAFMGGDYLEGYALVKRK